MKRSSGVTAAAVVMMIGSGVFLLFAAITTVSAVLIHGGHTGGPPRQIPSLLMGILVYLAGGILGLISSAGLLRLREWARIMTIVFSGIGLTVSIFMIVVFYLVLMPMGAQMTPQALFTFRLISSLIILVPASISLWWLIYFLTAGAKAQFAGEFEGEPRGLPLSMTMIGWYLIVASFFSPMSTLRYGLAVQFLRVLHPPASYASAAVLMLWGTGSGIGMLKRRRWGWMGAIAFHVLALINLACIEAKPEIFTGLIATISASARNPTPPFVVSVLFVRVIMGCSMALDGVILWFLITRRNAFTAESGDPNALPAENRAL